MNETLNNKQMNITLEKILEIDSLINNLIDTRYREKTDLVLIDVLNIIEDVIPDSFCFVEYTNPKTFDGKERNYKMVLSKKISDELANSLNKIIYDYRTKKILNNNPLDVKPLKTNIGKDTNVFAIPMFTGAKPDFTGIIGLINNKSNDNCITLLKQVASRIDTFIRLKAIAIERTTVMKKINESLDKEGIDGIGKTLQLLTEFTECKKGAIIYLEHAVDNRQSSKHNIGLFYVENNKIVEKVDILSKLDFNLGKAMIDYDKLKIDDSNYGLRTLGIIYFDQEAKKEKQFKYHCEDLVNRSIKDNHHNIGKLFLIGNENFDQTLIDAIELAAMQIDTKLINYHDQKKALGRSLHPDQVEFFIKNPKIAKWFFENPREETIAMVFTDICGYTSMTRKLGNPRKTIEGAKSWIVMEKNLTLKHGGFFDKEVGDCAVSLFGPPFCSVNINDLELMDNVEEVEKLVKSCQSEPHIYAYHAVMYAIESIEAVKEFEIGESKFNLSVGIEVGKVAVGDLTGDIGRLTAMGDSMNLAARLQGLAGTNQIFIGPECNRLLEIYKKEAYLTNLPFEVIKGGEAQLKGYDTPVPYYIVSRDLDKKVL
ncbi:MAG: adenylate/guanylate cyclase domain-containing protein [Spirochaetota bacterium]|nr:adenylate/guanylate cyclase domain-containing protein [Spirochaetota bacterium]